MSRRLILASTSPYRRELLSRLNYPFECSSPQTDEAALPGESPVQTSVRLAELKARMVANQFPGALIIGSDQVAHDGIRTFGKPGNHERAALQLEQLSGRTVEFCTGVCVLDVDSSRAESRCVITKVTFRRLSAETIESYLNQERPYNCAGSAKSEGLGIALIANMECSDPTALIGLPLIALVDLLTIHGLRLL